MPYKVVEKFVSINGEGKKAGEIAVFIRFAGCNLNCSYCDTMWANKTNTVYKLMEKEEIYNYITETGIKNITLTGGEPLLQDDIKELIDFLLEDRELYIEIETNGSIPLDNFKNYSSRNLSFTMDYKGPSSNMEDKMFLDNFSKLSEKDTLKFVVGNEEDLDKSKYLIEKYNLAEKCTVFFSPIYGQIKTAQIVTFMKDHCMNRVKLQLQLHKIIWDPEKKGV